MSGTGWSTREELAFLKHIEGAQNRHSKGSALPRPELLRRYREAARRRTDWGEIDARRILNYVDGELRKYQELQACLSR
jgi:hypothetical protein